KAHGMTSWTGCYGGLHVGLGGQRATFTTFQENIWGCGLLGGAQIGCNYQLGRFVVGLESEFWGSSMTTRLNYSGVTPEDTRITTANPWTAATSIRAGVAFDVFLVYLKGGIAWGAFSYNPTSNFAEDTARGSAINTGVLLGFGFENAFAPQWTAKVEIDALMFT